MTKTFELSIVKENNTRQIDFANHSSNFVEVVFTIDNKEVKYGDYFSPSIKGYCYPPSHHKPIRTMKNGSNLPFATRGTLKAYIYAGTGELIEKNYDVPPFIQFKLNEKRFRDDKTIMRNFFSRGGERARFRRLGNNPIEVLEIPY